MDCPALPTGPAPLTEVVAAVTARQEPGRVVRVIVPPEAEAEARAALRAALTQGWWVETDAEAAAWADDPVAPAGHPGRCLVVAAPGDGGWTWHARWGTDRSPLAGVDRWVPRMSTFEFGGGLRAGAPPTTAVWFHLFAGALAFDGGIGLAPSDLGSGDPATATTDTWARAGLMPVVAADRAGAWRAGALVGGRIRQVRGFDERAGPSGSLELHRGLVIARQFGLTLRLAAGVDAVWTGYAFQRGGRFSPTLFAEGGVALGRVTVRDP